MIGDPAGAHPRRSHTGLGIVVAALGLVLLFVVIRYGLLPRSLPFDLPFSLPPLFWLSLLALGSIGLVAHVARRERARARARRDAPAGPNLEEEPQLRPNALDEPEPAPEVATETIFAPPVIAAVPAAAAVETDTGDELPDLLVWLKGISASISQWTVEVAEELHDPPVGLNLDEVRHQTSNLAIPKIGSWTDLRARVAIEKYLRTRPWAPATDVAKALGMDIALAARLTQTLRNEGFR